MFTAIPLVLCMSTMRSTYEKNVRNNEWIMHRHNIHWAHRTHDEDKRENNKQIKHTYTERTFKG